jgi:hypothetical protein
MTDVTTGTTAHGDSPEERAQTLIVSSRLVLAANTTLQLTFLFTFLYLRANNFGGSWLPSGIGISPPPEVLALLALLAPVVALVALWAVSNAMRKDSASSSAARSVNGLLWLALAFVVLTGAIRIFLMYQFGSAWNLQNGTYIDVSVAWYGVILAEFILAGLWTMSLVMGHVRGTAPITNAQSRALVEQWSYITVAAFAVYALVEFVT